jgi:HEAT repeat protein
MRALAVLGLGALRDRSAAKDVAALAMENGAGATARAAAAYVLGEIGGEQDRATLLSLAHGTDALSRQMALVALSRMPPSPQPIEQQATIAALADALFVGGEPESTRDVAAAAAIRRAGAAALMVLARGAPRAGAEGSIPAAAGGSTDTIDVGAVLRELVPGGFTAAERAATLVKFEEPIARAATSALTSPNGVRAVVDALSEGDGALEPFQSASSPEGPARDAARRVARAIEPRLASSALTPEVIVLLARSSNPAAMAAVVRALSDGNEVVQRTALSAVGAHADREAVAEVSRILSTQESWAMRVLAAQAMGRLGSAGAPAAADSALLQAAVQDPYALVREAALSALATFDQDGARTLARRMMGVDPEPRVRETARRIASSP